MRSSIFGQAYRALRKRDPRIFRLSEHERAWKTRYVNLHATDAGGVYRDCIETICRELQSPWLPLLVACPNQRTALGMFLTLVFFNFVSRELSRVLRASFVATQRRTAAHVRIFGTTLRLGD